MDTLLKALLGKIIDGDHGSTALGAIAAAILASGVDFSKLGSFTLAPGGAAELGKLAGAVILALWGFNTGKPKA